MDIRKLNEENAIEYIIKRLFIVSLQSCFSLKAELQYTVPELPMVELGEKNLLERLIFTGWSESRLSYEYKSFSSIFKFKHDLTNYCYKPYAKTIFKKKTPFFDKRRFFQKFKKSTNIQYTIRYQK